MFKRAIFVQCSLLYRLPKRMSKTGEGSRRRVRRDYEEETEKEEKKSYKWEWEWEGAEEKERTLANWRTTERGVPFCRHTSQVPTMRIWETQTKVNNQQWRKANTKHPTPNSPSVPCHGNLASHRAFCCNYNNPFLRFPTTRPCAPTVNKTDAVWPGRRIDLSTDAEGDALSRWNMR